MKRKIAFAFVLIGITIPFVVFTLRSPVESVYQGQPLGHWLAALADDDSELRERAHDVLLEVLCRDNQAGDRAVAAGNLWRVGKGDARTMIALINALKDECPLVRKQVVVSLSLIGSHSIEAMVGLVDSLKDEDDEVSETAYKALLCLGQQGKKGIPALITLLKGKNQTHRIRAVDILGEIGNDAAICIPELEDLLTDEYCHRAAANALRKIRQKRGGVL